MTQRARRHRIHIEVTLITLKEEIISRKDFMQFLTNIAQAYGVKPERENDVYHIRAWDQTGHFRILGNMGETFEHFAGQYGEIVQKLAEKRQSAEPSKGEEEKVNVALCARITSPSLTETALVLTTVNMLFAKYRVGVYFESFPGGMVLYVEDKHGWDIVMRMVDPAYIQFKEENRALMTSAPLEYLRNMAKYLGIDNLTASKGKS